MAAPATHAHIISIHAAQEGCDGTSDVYFELNVRISIHAAQEGCDCKNKKRPVLPAPFQSTQPKRAATALGVKYKYVNYISIHAAQEGCDHGCA